MTSPYTRWHPALSVKLAGKDDPTWWTDSVRGHRSHALLALTLVDVNSSEDGRRLGQELHFTIGRLRVGLAMRFSRAELSKGDAP